MTTIELAQFDDSTKDLGFTAENETLIIPKANETEEDAAIRETKTAEMVS